MQEHVKWVKMSPHNNTTFVQFVRLCRSKFGKLIAISVLFFLALLYFPFSEERYDPLIARIADAFHLPMGFALSVICMWVMAQLGFNTFRSSLIVFFSCAILGALGEITQPLFGRGCSFSDWLFGVFGLFSGIGISSIFRHGALKFRTLFYWFMGTAFLLLLALFPAYRVFQLVQSHEQLFPKLTDFSLAREESLWKRSVGKGVLRLKISDTEFGKSLIFSGRGRGFFGGELSIPRLPWTGYSSLKLELLGIGLAQAQDVRQIIVRIDDCHRSKEYNDRYNGSFAVKNGITLISIPLDDIVKARVDPEMDLSCIERLVIFISAEGEEFAFGIKNIWLD